MTRMWLLDPKKMCDDHLVGEHGEMHMIVGTIRNHPHGEAIVRGHARKGQIDTSLIQQRHDELEEEMKRRGMHPDKPLDYEDELNLGNIDEEKNRIDLANRCDNCGFEV